LKGVTVYREIDRDISVGDRLQFTMPDKKLGVANRDLGTIENIAQPTKDRDRLEVTVKMDSGKSVTFDPRQMRNFDHGYAVTSHSSQGLTADRVLVNMDMDVHKNLINTRFAYVSISRAKIDAQIFTNDASRLAERLSTDISKESAIDARQLNREQPQTIDQTAATNSRERTHQSGNEINDLGLNSAANTNAETSKNINSPAVSNDNDQEIEWDME
jgi:ATP-dependent exoDNAse (exonuclease V) alpha subunit